MNLDFLKALVISLEACHGYKEGNIEETAIFIASQEKKMPDYFSFSLRILSSLLELMIFITHMKRFHQLTNERQTKLVNFFRSNDFPIISLFLRFVESSFLMKYLESSHAKKI